MLKSTHLVEVLEAGFDTNCTLDCSPPVTLHLFAELRVRRRFVMTNLCADVIVRSQEGQEEAARPLVRGGNADRNEIVVFNPSSILPQFVAEVKLSS